MPQMQLPLFPDGVEHITSELAFEKGYVYVKCWRLAGPGPSARVPIANL
jgi:hypothetical protein